MRFQWRLVGRVAVQDCLEMRCVGSSTEGLPPGVEAIPGPRTQRQVHCPPLLTPMHCPADLHQAMPDSGLHGRSGPRDRLCITQLHYKSESSRVCLLVHSQCTAFCVWHTLHCMISNSVFVCLKEDINAIMLHASQV